MGRNARSHDRAWGRACVACHEHWYDRYVAGEPRHKGVGLLAVVKALKANPHVRDSVPSELQHYLTDSILVTGWYPERDYNVLLELLVRGVDRKLVVGDVWRYFGKLAAQRDIAGEQKNIPAASRTESAGVYRRFGDGDPHDVAGLFARVVTMWSLYHDTGKLSVARHASEPSTVVMRLTGFQFPCRGHLELQAGFMEEYARLVGTRITGSLTRSHFDGAKLVEWHYQVQHNSATLASISTLAEAV